MYLNLHSEFLLFYFLSIKNPIFSTGRLLKNNPTKSDSLLLRGLNFSNSDSYLFFSEAPCNCQITLFNRPRRQIILSAGSDSGIHTPATKRHSYL